MREGLREDGRRCLAEVTCAPTGAEPTTVSGGEAARDLRARAAFPAALEVFAGHFPGAPLVPGVLLIEVLRAACEDALERPLAIRAVEEARFTGQVEPDRSVTLEAQLTPLPGNQTWLCRGVLRLTGRLTGRLTKQLAGEGVDPAAAGEVARLRLVLVREEDG